MAQEIERKYLVAGQDFLAEARHCYDIKQAYLSVRPTVRLRTRDDRAFLTIKGPSDPKGLSRGEWEYEIPLAEAQAMLPLALGTVIEKKRYLVPYAGHTWEVDVFEGAHAGLIIAELELQHEDEVFARPPWLGAEVTGDKRYYNANLAQKGQEPTP